jgi:hypothetical protein
MPGGELRPPVTRVLWRARTGGSVRRLPVAQTETFSRGLGKKMVGRIFDNTARLEQSLIW